MDLLDLEVEETSTLELLDSADQPLTGDDEKPITVLLYGPGSKQYQRAKTSQSNRYLRRMARKGSNADATSEERVTDDANLLTACTASFSDNFKYGGEPASDHIADIYRNPKLGFLGEQVAKHIGEWSNFTKGSTPA